MLFALFYSVVFWACPRATPAAKDGRRSRSTLRLYWRGVGLFGAHHHRPFRANVDSPLLSLTRLHSQLLPLFSDYLVEGIVYIVVLKLKSRLFQSTRNHIPTFQN